MPRLGAMLVFPFVVLFSTGLAVADDQAPGGERPEASQPAPSPANPDRLANLLRAWENRFANLKTLEFSIYQVDRDPESNEQHYEGHAAFQSPKLGYVDIKKIKMAPDDKKKMVPQLDSAKRKVSWPVETTIWTNEELWRYRYDTKRVFISRLNSGSGLRSLKGGPLPFLFNVKAADVQGRFDLVLLDAKETQYLVKVVPKLENDPASFSAAWIVLDAKALLPVRILLLLADEKSTQDYYLSRFQINEPVKDSLFRGVQPGKPWKIVHDRPGHAPTHAKNGAAQRPPHEEAGPPPVEPDVDQPH